MVVAEESVEMSARQAGRIEHILVELGQRVTRDTLLATLDARSARKDRQMADATAGAAAAQVNKATIDLKEAGDRFVRLRRLGSNLVSAEDLSAAIFKVQAARTQLASARAGLREQKARQGLVDSTMSDTEMRAPFDGKVAARYLNAGAVVAAGTPVLRLISDRELTVRFAVPADRAAALKPELPIVARLEPPGGEVPGLVTTFSPEIDAASGMLFVEARLLPGHGAPPPAGAMVRVRLSAAP
jgi:RND family efflux transporter MFP subunit